jgi:hypothetical protein
MKIKDLIKKLKEFPEDMELLVNVETYFDIDNFNIYKDERSYCKYSTHWNSNAIYYGYKDVDNFRYLDFIDGKNVSIEIPTERKEVVILEV